MSHITRLAAAALCAGALVTGAAATATAGPFDSGSGQVAQPGQNSRGPFESLAECLGRGNRGMDNGEWNDYDCVGSYGSYYIQPK
ncbi:hypothetical protein ACFVUS_00055 [Nocardia sp. NPDC058058]|uniref:hypothetical protein n=1 Tax=Nocardia sp. NPDC058058 TaxID=3346317 RepID=UPI0036DB2707